MPARVSRIGFRRRRVLGLAYSDRYIAAPRPSGVAITIAISATSIVPMNIVGMSNSPCRGDHWPLHNDESSTWDRNEIA